MKNRKRSKSQRMAMVLAIALAAMMLLGIVALIIDSLLSPAAAAPLPQRVTQAHIAEQRNAASAIRQKAAVEELIAHTEDEIRHTEDLLALLAEQLIEKEEEIAAAIEEEREAYRLYLQRIRAAEEQPPAVYLGILLMSDNIMDFLTRLDNMADILRHDDGIRERLETARAGLEELKYGLERDQAEQIQIQEGLVSTRADLIAQSDRVQELIDSLLREINTNRSHANDLQRQENEANERQAALIQEMERQRVRYVGGEYTWPVPGHTIITSYFGSRTHPILRTPSNHTGIDIGAPSGARVVAANEGTVHETGRCGVYGLYIVINHGGGRSTMYAHLSRVDVRAKQEVAKGAAIGRVGSTGLSTGPHLHFEWRRDGEPRNPIITAANPNGIFRRNN